MTRNFTMEELLRSSFALKKKLSNTPNDKQLQNMRVSVLALEYLRAYFGNVPIVVTSGFRSPELNKAIGGSPTSSHIDGQAYDIVIMNNLSMKENALSIIRSDINFDQIIVYKSFIHLGLGPKKRRQLISR